LSSTMSSQSHTRTRRSHTPAPPQGRRTLHREATQAWEAEAEVTGSPWVGLYVTETETPPVSPAVSPRPPSGSFRIPQMGAPVSARARRLCIRAPACVCVPLDAAVTPVTWSFTRYSFSTKISCTSQSSLYFPLYICIAQTIAILLHD